MAVEHVVDLLIAALDQSGSSADWNIDAYWQRWSHVETRHSSPVSLFPPLMFVFSQTETKSADTKDRESASVDTSTRPRADQ